MSLAYLAYSTRLFLFVTLRDLNVVWTIGFVYLIRNTPFAAAGSVNLSSVRKVGANRNDEESHQTS